MQQLRGVIVRDDRGADQPLLDPRGGAWHGSRDPSLERLWRRVGVWQASPWSVAAGGAWGLLVVPLYALLRSVLGPHASSTVVTGCVVAMALLYGRLVMDPLRQRALNRSGRLVAQTVLREGLCPSCTYSLHGLESEHDACVVCPECGAAWMRRRIVRSAPTDVATAGRAEARPRWKWSFGDQVWAKDQIGTPIPLMGKRERPYEPFTSVDHRVRFERAVRDGFGYRRHRMIVVGVVLLGLGVAVFPGTIWVVGQFARSMPWTVRDPINSTLIVLSLGCTACAVACYAFWHSPSGRAIVLAFEREKVCASCGADLASAIAITPESGGLASCPTCDARWRLDEPRCLSCRARFDNSTPDANGRVVCAACGEAWQRGAEGSCARCKYPLRDVPRAADGVVICPECGLATGVGIPE